MKIAHGFNRGYDVVWERSPEGTVEIVKYDVGFAVGPRLLLQPFLRNLFNIGTKPTVETVGYSYSSLPGTAESSGAERLVCALTCSIRYSRRHTNGFFDPVLSILSWFKRFQEPFYHFSHGGNDFWKPRSISSMAEMIFGNSLAFLPWYNRFAGTARRSHHGGIGLRIPRGISPIVGPSRGNRLAFLPWWKCFAVSENHFRHGRNASRDQFCFAPAIDGGA